MEKIIYSKFSDERGKAFRVRTDIIQNEVGEKSVLKTAMTPEASGHIEQIYKWYSLLSSKYKDTDIFINQCECMENGLKFEYLCGTTLEEEMDSLYEKQDYSSIIDLMFRYAEKVKKHEKLEKFVKTDKFIEVFGNVEFEQIQMSGTINNIDLIFSNIILDNGWHIIDYEWTFDFPIPIDFIIYRAIHYYILSTKRSELKKIGIFQLLGYTEKDLKTYQYMEDHFQLYILQSIVPLANLYPLVSGKNVDLQEVIQESNGLTNDVQIYYDCGNGFSEEESYIQKNNGNGCLEIILQPNVRRIRIDPSNKAGILIIYSILEVGPEVRKLQYQTNGVELYEQTYLFKTNDPRIELEHLKEGALKIQVSYNYEILDQESILSLIKIGEKFSKISEDLSKAGEELKEYSILTQQLNTNIASLNNENAVLNQQLFLAQQDYINVTSSFIWRISKPYRYLMDHVRELLKTRYRLYAILRFLKKTLRRGPKAAKRDYLNEKERKRTEHIEHMLSSFQGDNLQSQKATVFEDGPKFSILVPLYNTSSKFLIEMIESVLAQSYINWELCLADGSDRKHSYVKKICKYYRYLDKRIKYRRVENGGISYNTNKSFEMATGSYVGLLDHDDFLHPSALYEVASAIRDENADFIYTDEITFVDDIEQGYNSNYKPDYSPDMLRGDNYICHFSVIRRSIFEKIAGFRKEFDGSQDYDLILRVTEIAEKIKHIPKILYYWRAHESSVAMNIGSKMYAFDAARNALREHLQRIGLRGTVEDTNHLGWYRIRYEIDDTPMISILIPNKDEPETLKKCIDSIQDKTTYKNYEIIIIENNSVSPEIFSYYDELKNADNIRVVSWKGIYNYSSINNFGVEHAKGEYLLLLNNDIEVITPDWIQEMLMFAQRKDVGAVGAMLYYPDDTIQHAGVYLGLGGIAGHGHKHCPRGYYGYTGRLLMAQNVTAVTAACLMVKKSIYKEVGGLDEDFQVAFNDIDFCMKIVKKGYLNVFTPFAELYHYESKSRGLEDTPEKLERFNSEIREFVKRWKTELLKGDPYYNPNLSLVKTDFSIMAENEANPVEFYCFSEEFNGSR